MSGKRRRIRKRRLNKVIRERIRLANKRKRAEA